MTPSQLLSRPLKRKLRREPVIKKLSKKKLDFEALVCIEENANDGWITKTSKLSIDPSSPIKIHELGYCELRSRLAPCQCVFPAETCETFPCECPPVEKKHCFPEEKIRKNKKISLKCTCPVECKPFQSAQEFW